jgi:hypothetical protein
MTDRNTKEWKTPSATSRDEVTRFESIGLASTDEERLEMHSKNYLQVMGSLLFAACMTRPDIAYHCAFLCQFMQDPSPAAYEAALAVLSYLKHSAELGLTFGGSHKRCSVPEADTSTGIISFNDASFGKTAYPFIGGFSMYNNSLVSWFSRKVKFVADSTCMIEMAAANAGLREAIFAGNLTEDMFGTYEPPHIITDSKSAYDIIRHPGVTKRSVHFDRWLHFGRDAYLHNRAKFFLAKTDEMMADGMTKVVDRTKFFICRSYMMNI